MSTTTEPAPVAVIVDCSAQATADSIQLVANEIRDAIVNGDTETYDAKTAELATLQEQAPEPTVERPLTDEELAQQAHDQAASLDQARAAKADQVKAAIAVTDQWAARAVEEAIPMPKDRIAYRQQLRGLFAEITSAGDVASLEAIEIPAPPAPPA